MSKIMLVNVTHVEESRVAILEDGVLASYEIETLNRTHIKGNIYNAVVEAALGSLEASFLNIAPGLKGFLPLDEVNFRLLPARGERGKGGRIGQHLASGQKLMVQVVREPYAGKPPTVSTFFSLPGRYLVLMPGVDSAGISRRIGDSAQRDRLKKIIEELNPPEGFGLIVRTAGLGQTKTELQRDLRYLLRLWESIQRASAATAFPGLVYRESDLVIRTIRDYFTPDIREVWIDSKDTYERALEFVKDVMPTKAKTLRLYTGDRPLFNKFNLEEQIESIYKRQVPLKSGGAIVIDGTEALTAIDVNSGRSRKGDAEETVTQTNIEAADEIARQLRLRDLGGLIVIDFIDMAVPRNKKKVEKAMRDAMKGDKAKYDVTPISKLGLMEIARQRIKGEKMGATYAACPTCEGYGLVKNVDAAGLAALRKLQTLAARGNAGRIRMTLPAEVAVWMLNHTRERLAQIERNHRIRIEVSPSESLLRHESKFDSFARERAEEPQAAADGPTVAPDAAEVERARARDGVDSSVASRPEAAATASEPAATGGRKRRRRRRHSRAGVLTGTDDAATERQAESATPAPPSTAPGDLGAEAARPVAEPTADAPGQPAEAEGAGGGRKRRRRRRRRRSGSNGASTASASRGSDDGARSADSEPAVPQRVESNQLMPAASGRAEGQKTAGRSRGPRKRGGAAAG